MVYMVYSDVHRRRCGDNPIRCSRPGTSYVTKTLLDLSEDGAHRHTVGTYCTQLNYNFGDVKRLIRLYAEIVSKGNMV